MTPATRAARTGTAGWSIPRALAESFPGDGSHLARHVCVQRCAEVNTSFKRSHRPEALRVGRVAADPTRWPAASRPGRWLGPAGGGGGAVLYHRWHGSPRLYHSAYGDDRLQARAAEMLRWPAAAARWRIFDNAASSAAAPQALRLCAYR